MIQISSGILRGLKLKSPLDSNVRPTSVRTRQAIFNILRNYQFNENNHSTPILENACVCDGFAGTGAFGLDAISNGARSIHFIESSTNSLRILNENIMIFQKSYLNQRDESFLFNVYKNDILKIYNKLPAIRVFFCDPPYRKGYFEKIIQLEESNQNISPGGLLIFEEAADVKLNLENINAARLRLSDSKIYGDSAVHFFVKF